MYKKQLKINFEESIKRATLTSSQRKTMQKCTKKWSTSACNCLSMSRWYHFWDDG